MNADLIAKLGIGGGPLLIAKIGLGEPLGGAAVGQNYVGEYSVIGSTAAEYTVAYRIHGRIADIGAGGPDDEWVHPRVKKFLEDAERAAREMRYAKVPDLSQESVTAALARKPNKASSKAAARIEDELDEIAELLMLID